MSHIDDDDFVIDNLDLDYYEQIFEFVCSNFISMQTYERRTQIHTQHCVKFKDAYAKYIDWINEYDDVVPMNKDDFKTYMNNRFHTKYHDPDRVKIKNGRRITGQETDGWWGYLNKKDYVELGYADLGDDLSDEE
tara:strand:+ start:53 stop:457 length:405 start_codon:yes stop_codon:yes gene_type:complete